MTAPAADPCFAEAHRTMLRGLAYVEAEVAGLAGLSDLVPTWPTARFIGNHLRELDVFLVAMLDAAVRDLGAGPNDRRRFRRGRSTHGKLQRVLALSSAASAGDGPLCATGTLRSCLNRQGGFVGELDRIALARDLGELGATLSEARLIVPPATLRTICGLYRGAAGEMVAALHQVKREDIDYSSLCAHISCANVACDGS